MAMNGWRWNVVLPPVYVTLTQEEIWQDGRAGLHSSERRAWSAKSAREEGSGARVQFYGHFGCASRLFNENRHVIGLKIMSWAGRR